jgi:two-component system NtrC family sensor kinase
MNLHLQSILQIIQGAESVNDAVKKNITDAVKEVDKALTITEFKLDRTDKVKRTTAILLEETIEELEQKRKAIEETNNALTRSLEELKAAQTQLVQAEKMASLGQLTAGIAHEIQNPLNFVNNFSELSGELIQELLDEMAMGRNDEAKHIADDIAVNLQKINHHGKRADTIVKGMLQHSRPTTGHKEQVSIRALIDEYLKLAFHAFRGQDNSFMVKLNTDFDPSVDIVHIAPQEIGRVLLNMFNNAFYAVQEKKRKFSGDYEPTVTITSKSCNEKFEIVVKDNGTGIPETIIEKVFQPFFTTKPTGQGTGLGLSLSYDIVKSNGGEIRVNSKYGEGAIFVISLPVGV